MATIPLEIDRLPLAYIRMDASARILDWNAAAERIFGYVKQEALGRACLDLIVPVPVQEQLQEVIRRVWSGDMEAHSVNDNCTKDGRIITCEWFNTPLLDADGKCVGVISLAQDITDRQLVTRKLEENHALLRAVIEGIPDCIYVKDRAGRHLLANSAFARLLGLPPQRIVGQDDSVCFAPETARCFREADIRVMESGESETYEELVTLAGVGRDFLTTKAPYRDATGAILGVLGISRDITERKRAEEVLREYADRLQALSRRVVEVQEEERRHLAHELHDEIGQILTAIRIDLHALQGIDLRQAPGRLEDCVGMVDRAVDQVRALALQLRPAMLDALGLEAAVHWLVESQARRAGLEAHVHSNLAGTRFDARRESTCYRVVQEAVTNVMRHAQAQRVEVTVECHEREVRLRIRDNGIGFDVAAARRRAARGETFGLLAMDERVSLVAGSMGIHSAPARGTDIQVRIPLT